MNPDPSPSGENEDRKLVAGVGDDPLGVHVVTEFLFCPRAGVIAHESEEKDRGQDIRPVRLGYLPRYEQARIAEAIGRVTLYLLGGVFGGLLVMGLFGILAFTVSPAFLIACWLLLAALIAAVVAGIWVLVVLTYRYSQASGRPAKGAELLRRQTGSRGLVGPGGSGV